jgi:acetylornithine deacetylase/succinyl-diaminopimelate desuccinylase-like protein
MRLWGFAVCLCGIPALWGQASASLGNQTVRFLTELIQLDTANPPGNETRVAEYLKRVVASSGIPCELLGDDPSRLNFVARVKGSGAAKPLLLMAHSDVVPADRALWTVPPFAGLSRDGFVWGRGALDDKSLLAAELAVLLELKRRGIKLKRDVILLAESDEEAASTGMQWLVQNAWPKIAAEFAINEGGSWFTTPSGRRIFQIQTAEKVPTRVKLTARGGSGHGALPRADNAVVHLSRAITRLAETDQPVRLNSTTRRYLKTLARLPEYDWLASLLPALESEPEAFYAAAKIRLRDPELDAMLRTSISPTMLQAGIKINVIPNTAVAQVDVRRLPTESSAEIVERMRRQINDPAVEITLMPGQRILATEPSSLTTPLYLAMERVFSGTALQSVVVPLMARGATDGAFLRPQGVAVYGAPIFGREPGNRAHGNDERISIDNLRNGAELLWKIVLAVAAEPDVASK